MPRLRDEETRKLRNLPEYKSQEGKQQSPRQSSRDVATRYNPHNSTGRKLQVYENSLYLKKTYTSESKKPPPKRKEKDIQRFSKKSRTRMFHRLNQLQVSQLSTGLFTSCTFHEDYEISQEFIDEKRQKFLRILRDKIKDLVYVWRVEFQERGAPHFHFIFWTLNPELNFESVYYKRIIRDAWYQVKECQCKGCRRHSVKTLTVSSFRKTAGYVSKYIAKEDEEIPEECTGRRWGWSSNTPANPVLDVEILPWQEEKLKKLVKKWIRIRLAKNNRDDSFLDEMENIHMWAPLETIALILRQGNFQQFALPLENWINYGTLDPPDEVLAEIAESYRHQ